METTDSEKRALNRALAKLGGGAAFARRLGITKSAVSQWKRSRVPAEWLPLIEAETGVTAAELRPDLLEFATDNEPVVLTPTVSEATPHTECCSAPVAPSDAPAPEATPPAQAPSAQPMLHQPDEPAHHHEQGEAA